MSRQIFLSILLFVLVTHLVQGQGQNSVTCGTIMDGEFLENLQEHPYIIEVSPGDQINISATALGDHLLLQLDLYDPTGNLISVSSGSLQTFRDTQAEKNPTLSSGTLGARGGYQISVSNYDRYGSLSPIPRGIGVYTLFIGCTLRDGTVIEPGSSAQASTPTAPVFSGFGFPGLAPVDFANAVKLPLVAATPMTGAITPTGDEILSFRFDANAGDVLDLNLTRISGNLNLGLVVLSADNKVVSYGGLITGDTLSTRITLPSAGQYTIGVFRIDLLPPTDPQATAFQVTGTLNP